MDDNENVNAEIEEEPERPKRGRPRNPDRIRGTGGRSGLRIGEDRFNSTIDTERIEWLRDYAYTERLTIRAALEHMIDMLKDHTEGKTIEARDKIDILWRPDSKRKRPDNE